MVALDLNEIMVKTPKAAGIPPGNYRLVSWDIDATGTKLFDEIFNIAGYTPSKNFHQYIMPFKNLSYTASKRSNIKVIRIGSFRTLKSTKTRKVLKTKSVVSALNDFINWLENIKGNSDGIILIHHEPKKVIPTILLNTLSKYKLVDKFCSLVQGFANGFDIAKSKCDNIIRSYSIRTLSRVLLNEEGNVNGADIRANLTFRIIHHLSNGEIVSQSEIESYKSDKTLKRIVEFIREFVQPIETEEKEFKLFKLFLDRKFSLKPVFKKYFCATKHEKLYATSLRRLLAESNIDYSLLQKTWKDNGQMKGIKELIEKNLINYNDEKKVADILKIIECHFDVEKMPKCKIEISMMNNKNENTNEAIEIMTTKLSDLQIVDSTKKKYKTRFISNFIENNISLFCVI